MTRNPRIKISFKDRPDGPGSLWTSGFNCHLFIGQSFSKGNHFSNGQDFSPKGGSFCTHKINYNIQNKNRPGERVGGVWYPGNGVMLTPNYRVRLNKEQGPWMAGGGIAGEI